MTTACPKGSRFIGMPRLQAIERGVAHPEGELAEVGIVCAHRTLTPKGGLQRVDGVNALAFPQSSPRGHTSLHTTLVARVGENSGGAVNHFCP